MAIAIDGTMVPDKLSMMNCGGTPMFDHQSGCSYFCDNCFAIIGSISQPPECVRVNKGNAPGQNQSD